MNHNKLGLGYDLLAADIQRARDHGIQPYAQYLNYCLPEKRKITKWSDLKGIISDQVIYSYSKI